MRATNRVTLITAATVTLSSLPAGDAEAQWENAPVVTLAGSAADEVAPRFSVAVGADNSPHAIWISGSLGYYSREESGSWIAPVEIGLDDANYRVHAIAVVPGTNTPVVLASRRPIGSQVSDLMLWSDGFGPLLTTDELAEYGPALDVDASGAYHVVCVSEIEGEWRLRYLTDVTGTPTEQLVSAGPLGAFGSGASPAISVEPDGVAHIAYRGVTGGYRIHHAVNAAPGSSSWNWETMVTSNGEDLTTDIVFDATGGLHLAASGNDCWGCITRTYVFHQPAGGEWSPPVHVVHSQGLIAASLTADADGLAHLAAPEVSGNIYTGRLLYASERRGWTLSTIIGDDHQAPSLAVDADGYGHVVCTTGPNTGIEDVLYLKSEGLTVGVAEPEVAPGPFRLLVAPNPFSKSTVIRSAGHVTGAAAAPPTMEIYDVAGRRLRRLGIDPTLGSGEVVWDGTDDAGHPTPAGVYLIRDGSRTSTRIVKLR